MKGRKILRIKGSSVEIPSTTTRSIPSQQLKKRFCWGRGNTCTQWTGRGKDPLQSKWGTQESRISSHLLRAKVQVSEEFFSPNLELVSLKKDKMVEGPTAILPILLRPY